MAVSRPPVAIVGAGVVAQALGRLMLEGGQPVIALAGRKSSRAKQAAAFIGASVRPVTIAELAGLATHVIVAVSDQAITPVADALAAAGLTTGVALHTCGARGPEALAPLRRAGVACGLLHPLQTITTPEQGVASLVHATFALAGDLRATDWAQDIVSGLNGRSLRIEADRLSYYHAGAVMASGALVAAIDAAVALLARAGVDRDTALCALGPLARTSLANALEKGPEAALTGPVLRGDVTTIAAHLKALGDVDPTVAALYRASSAHLVGLARTRGLADGSARTIGAMVAAGLGDVPGPMAGRDPGDARETVSADHETE